MKIIVSNEIEQVCPQFVGAAVEAWVKNSAYSEALWQEIDALCEEYRKTLSVDMIKEWDPIRETRAVYRRCGKDPSRYRPAAEALIRRVLQGKALYQIDTLVDLINLASMRYGYSIGGFDADKFVGDTLTLGIGRHDEPYEGIGRGMINIEGLPVYRDAEGGVLIPGLLCSIEGFHILLRNLIIPHLFFYFFVLAVSCFFLGKQSCKFFIQVFYLRNFSVRKF